MNPFVKWLMSPVSEWQHATIGHKLFVGASGASLFWYLYKYKSGWPLWQRALASLGAAYGVSIVLNSVSRFAVPSNALPMGAPAPQMPMQQQQYVDPSKKDDLFNAAPSDNGMKMDLETAGLAGAEDDGIFG